MKLNLKIEQAKVEELAPYVKNSKKHTDEQVQHIANSIDNFGFNDPVGVWTNSEGILEIVEGHGRVLAAKQLGLKQVPIIKLDHLDDEGRRAYVHIHNKIASETGFDRATLEEELMSIEGIDFLDFGIETPSEKEIMELLSDGDDDFDEGAIETRCHEGDIWRLGDHILGCGSSLDSDFVRQTIDAANVDLLDAWITDPPYGVSYVGKTADALVIANDSLAEGEEMVNFLSDAFNIAISNCKPGAPFYIWHADSRRLDFLKACEAAEMTIRQVLIWVKNTFVLGRQDYQWQHEPCLYGWKGGAGHYFTESRNKTTTFYYDKPSASRDHPTMKPIGLIAEQVANSTRKGDVVFDDFGGSGTTLLACEQLGRRCVTVELDPHYCDVIISRWENKTGQLAAKVN